MSDIDLNPFRTLRRHLKIVHHVPGRVRLRVGASLFKEMDGVDSKTFDRILGAIDGIGEVRVNPMAASVVISYAPAKLQPEWWDSLVHGDEEQAMELLQRLIETQLAPAVAAARDA